MKRSVLAGLFITVTVLASPVFAGSQEDLCQINLQTLKNSQATLQNPELKTETEATMQEAKAAQARKTEAGTKDCIALTTKAIQQIENSTKGEGDQQ
jgi:pimeloyl-CoA synthetase